MGANLVTLAEVKTYAGINSTNQDATITQLIPQVSEFVKNYCSRSFIDYVNEAKINIVSGGDFYIYLDESPTLSIQSVEYSTDYGTTYTELTAGTDYVLDLQHDRLQVIGQLVFPKQVNGYKITYCAGYEILPTDLKLAVLDLVLYYLKSDMAVKSAAGPGRNSVAVEYIVNARLPAHIARVLDYYIQEVI